MDKKQSKKSNDKIVPLYMNGLYGRMLRLPPPAGKTKQILVVYGLHDNLEKIMPLARDLNRYGSVTVPDLPGLGGMQSFYRIGHKPTIDNLADYVAAFIKLRFKRGKVAIIGLGFGFAITTRLLQKYPELTKRVDLLVSSVGFVHSDDFILKRHNHVALLTTASLFSQRLPAWIGRNFLLKPRVLRATNRLMSTNVSSRSTKRVVDILPPTDLRTYMAVNKTMLTMNLCAPPVTTSLYHLSTKDPHIDHRVLEQHLKVIFAKVHIFPAKKLKPTKTRQSQTTTYPPLSPRIRRLLAKA